MPIRAEQVINNRYDAEAETVTGVLDLSGRGVTVKRASLYVVLEGLTGAPTDNLTLSVDFSPDDGQHLVDYDKLIIEAGVDAPVASVAYNGPQANLDDVVDISFETVFQYIAVTLAASNAGITQFDANNYIDAIVWLVYEY